MLVADVALGDCHDFYDYQTGLTEAPPGYQSTHGVKGSHEKTSNFKVELFNCKKIFSCILKIKNIVSIGA